MQGKGNKSMLAKLSESYEGWTEGERLMLAQLDAVKAYACVLTLRNTCTIAGYDQQHAPMYLLASCTHMLVQQQTSVGNPECGKLGTGCLTCHSFSSPNRIFMPTPSFFSWPWVSSCPSTVTFFWLSMFCTRPIACTTFYGETTNACKDKVCMSTSSTGSTDHQACRLLPDRLYTGNRLQIFTLIASSEGESVGSDSPEAMNST